MKYFKKHSGVRRLFFSVVIAVIVAGTGYAAMPPELTVIRSVVDKEMTVVTLSMRGAPGTMITKKGMRVSCDAQEVSVERCSISQKPTVHYVQAFHHSMKVFAGRFDLTVTLKGPLTEKTHLYVSCFSIDATGKPRAQMKKIRVGKPTLIV